MTDAATASTGKSSSPPLLLHLDVNKSVILADSVQSATIDDGIRESVAELFWGRATVERNERDEKFWEWTKDEPSCFPPAAVGVKDNTDLLTYSAHCKQTISDKKTRKKAVRDLSLVRDAATKHAMEKLTQSALARMSLPFEIRDSPGATDIGLTGSMHVMFPALFHMVARMQRAGRTFAIIFRTFGNDADVVTREWNAFCEMRHPVFSPLLQDIGPLDGSIPGVPDRRSLGFHTLYRDEVGPVLGLNVSTNGPEGSQWDKWARQKPKLDKDTREGRAFFAEQKIGTVEGYPALRQWMLDFCRAQSTAIIKDDWAWWTFQGEKANAGKLMLLEDSIQQIFFDDNVEHDDAHIVDCRNSDGMHVPREESMNKFMTKVNPVEAILDEAYFLKQLHRCLGDKELLNLSASAAETPAQPAPPAERTKLFDLSARAAKKQEQAAPPEEGTKSIEISDVDSSRACSCDIVVCFRAQGAQRKSRWV